VFVEYDPKAVDQFIQLADGIEVRLRARRHPARRSARHLTRPVLQGEFNDVQVEGIESTRCVLEES